MTKVIFKFALLIHLYNGIYLLLKAAANHVQGLIQAKNDSGYPFWAWESLCPDLIFFNFSLLEKTVENENFN